MMSWVPEQCFAEVAPTGMTGTVAADICHMLPATHEKGTFTILILYARGQAPGLGRCLNQAHRQGLQAGWRQPCIWEGGQPGLQ
jgi:hypothetical protein